MVDCPTAMHVLADIVVLSRWCDAHYDIDERNDQFKTWERLLTERAIVTTVIVYGPVVEMGPSLMFEVDIGRDVD